VRDQVSAPDTEAAPELERELRLLEERVRMLSRLLRETEAQVVVDDDSSLGRQRGDHAGPVERAGRKAVQDEERLLVRRGAGHDREDPPAVDGVHRASAVPALER
jgi:hypothetical protein